MDLASLILGDMATLQWTGPCMTFADCRLQTAECSPFNSLYSQVFSFPLLRANRKQANLGDIQANQNAILAQM